MYLIVECDGHSNGAPEGEMATGVVIRQSEKTKCKSGEVILRVQEPAGTGTGQMAEMIALLRGLTETRKMFMGTGEILGVEGIMIYSDSQDMLNRIMGIWKINSPEIFALNTQVQELRKEFAELNIPLRFKYAGRHFTTEAHYLANKVLYGDAYDAYAYNQRVLHTANRGETVIPLSIFKKAEYGHVTISEALVLELIEQRHMTRSQVAAALNRSYDTVRTWYNKAKKKTAGLTPPRILRK